MGQFDKEWNRVLENIMLNGVWQKEEHVRAKWDDGTPAPAKFVTGEKMVFDNSEALVPTTKEIKRKSPLRELKWIWFLKSNVVQKLRDLGSSIWDKWEIKEGEWTGTIGPAYGHQLGKQCRKFPVEKLRWEHLHPEHAVELRQMIEDALAQGFIIKYVMLDQVDFLIQGLLTNPGSRRYILSLWGIEDLDYMALEPCVWKTGWQYVDGKIDLITGVRSNDICVGNPFNVFQYQVLWNLICQVTGHTPGKIQFDLDNPHIYDRHIPEAMKQLVYPQKTAPKLWINPDIKNFYDFNPDTDVKLIDYEHGPDRYYEVAE